MYFNVNIYVAHMLYLFRWDGRNGIKMFIQTSMKINHLYPRTYNKKCTTCIEIKKCYLKFIVICLLHIFLHFFVLFYDIYIYIDKK